MVKKLIIMIAVVAGLAIADAPTANAWIYRRVAPVRRNCGTSVSNCPRVVARPAVIYRRPIYRAPVFYGPGVFVGVGF